MVACANIEKGQSFLADDILVHVCFIASEGWARFESRVQARSQSFMDLVPTCCDVSPPRYRKAHLHDDVAIV